MRKGYSNQLRLDSVPMEQAALNLEPRDRIVPVLRALQHVYCNRELAVRILSLVAGDTRDARGWITGIWSCWRLFAWAAI